MRRFIVIFLLLLLPIQVLAESLEDLHATHHRVALVEAADVASTNAAVALKRSTPSSDASNPQQAAHADISDSVNGAALCVHSPLSATRWPNYRPITFPSVYLRLIKPPRI